MKGAPLLIAGLALVVIASAGAAPPTPQFRVTVESGHIVVTDAKNGAYMGGTTFEKFGVTSTSTQDKLRHVALDTVAAVVAGNGSRQHTVAPDMPVYTVAEVKENKAPMPTATLEHGFVFVLLSDTQTNGRYEALVYMSKPESGGAPKG
jgi:hypothetical protein